MERLADRLRSERLRLKLTQRELAAIGQVQVNAQLRYEKGRRQPSARYLAAVAGCGVDLSFVLLGIRNSDRQTIAAEESAMIRSMRTLAGPEREVLVQLISTLASLTAKAMANRPAVRSA